MDATRTKALVTMVAAVVVGCATPGSQAQAQPLRDRAGAWSFEVLVDGAPAPTFQHRGETLLLGRHGERYVLRIHNHSGRRVEAVVSIDGLDAIDGRTADYAHKRGYLVPAYGSVDVDGWRLSNREAAAFRFGSVANSYAGQTGRARNVGVIGVAIFPERYVPPRPPVYVPYDHSYDRDDAPRSSSRGAGAPAAEAQSSAPPSAAPAEAKGRGSADVYAEGAPAKRKAESRPGLGTEFGEAVSSRIHEVAFVRASSSVPSALMGVRYNDRDGLIAMGVDVYQIDGWTSYDDSALRGSADPFPAAHGRRFARPPRGWQR